MKRTLAALLLVGCSGAVDVVARSESAPTGVPAGGTGGDPVKPSEPPSATANGPEPCPAAADGVAMLTKSLDLVRVDATVKGVLETRALGCAPGPIAIDRAGTLFVVADGHLTIAEGGVCKPTGIVLSASAMAFVWNPKTSEERLYAFDRGALVSVDPKTSQLVKVGPLAFSDVRSLAATSDGSLYAFSADANDAVVEIGLVSLVDATILATWGTKNPDGSHFGGGVPTQVGFGLVFGPRSFAFRPATGALTLHSPLFASDPGVVSIASSPCSILDTK